MQIFIEANKSNNIFIQQEKFQEFDETLFNAKQLVDSNRKNSNTSASSEYNPFYNALSGENSQPMGLTPE